MLLGLLEPNPTVRMSVGEAHRALYSEPQAAKTDPAPDALAAVQRVLSSRDDGGKGQALDAKKASLTSLASRQSKATAGGGGEEEDGNASKRARR